ncbi:MAG: hypothetical protein AB9897_07115 [Anaerolineaceae bacterium]
MEKIRALFKNPLLTGIAGLVIGLVIGLPLLGWWLIPVQWKDADASLLRQDLKAQYFCMIVDSYRVNQNAALADARLDSMGINALNYSNSVISYQASGCTYSAADEAVLALGSTLSAVPATNTITSGTTSPLPTAISNQPAATKTKNSGLTGILAGLLCVLFLGIGGLLIYKFFFRNRKPREQIPPSSDLHDFENPLDESGFTPESTQPNQNFEASSDMPAAHFMTTYVIGDDLYDDSFSIDTAKGDFLGECGVGISDTIGVGDPKKISAFEVWLFDKNDTQTVTKVLMSSRAMNDPAIRQRLASRGEPILIEPGQQIVLETPSLQLQARVIEMVYGQGAMPTGSYFERLTLELSVWAK